MVASNGWQLLMVGPNGGRAAPNGRAGQLLMDGSS